MPPTPQNEKNMKIIYLELSPPIFTEEAIEVEAGKDRAQKAAGGI